MSSSDDFPMSDDNDFSFPNDDGSDDFDFSGMDDDDDFNYDIENEDSDEVEDIEIQISNCYYTGKSIMNNEPEEALQGFKQLLDMEPEKGEWGFKALKQIIKLQFMLGKYDEMVKSYKKLLSYVRSAVPRNMSEKAITVLLEKISSTNDFNLIKNIYDMTLETLNETNNERFWFKTKLKMGNTFFEQEKFEELEKTVDALKLSCKKDDGSNDMKKGTQLLEIYALEIQTYTIKKNNKKLREIYENSLNVNSAIPHPRIMAVIRECGGKMHMEEENWEDAQKAFFEAFKNYDEAGSSRRIQCLKYMVLANLLSLSEINPFSSPESASYKNDPQIVAMTDLVAAYENSDIKAFEKVLNNNRSTIMDDKFISMYIKDLLLNIRSQVLVKILKPYTRVKLSFIANELNISQKEVETLLVTMILDEKISGKIDQINQLLILQQPGIDKNLSLRYDALSEWTNQLKSINHSVVGKLNG